jgi:hypothetical protein
MMLPPGVLHCRDRCTASRAYPAYYYPRQPFYLIVTDHDRRVFAVEGPITDSRPWDEAATFARSKQRHVDCGPTGPNRDELAAGYRDANRLLAGVPPGTIIRPRLP